MFHVLGIVTLVCAGGGAAVCGLYLRKPGQPGWDAWTMLALSVAGAAVSGAALLLLA